MPYIFRSIHALVLSTSIFIFVACAKSEESKASKEIENIFFMLCDYFKSIQCRSLITSFPGSAIQNIQVSPKMRLLHVVNVQFHISSICHCLKWRSMRLFVFLNLHHSHPGAAFSSLHPVQSYLHL